MAETKKTKDMEGADTTGVRPLALSKEYSFEGEKVKEIDFSKAGEVTAATMMRIDRILVSSGNVSAASENTLAYALCFAAECTDYPVEFYERLSPNDAIRVKNRVQAFLTGQV